MRELVKESRCPKYCPGRHRPVFICDLKTRDSPESWPGHLAGHYFPRRSRRGFSDRFAVSGERLFPDAVHEIELRERFDFSSAFRPKGDVDSRSC
jgi:hypothetical protein